MTGAPTTSPLLPALVAQYGLSGALELLKLLDPNASTASQGLGAAKLGVTALQGASKLSPALAGSQLGQSIPYLGQALALAGLGYGLTGIAKSDLPIKKKVGHSVDSAVAAAVPMYGLSKAADYVFAKMQQSGSPQQRRFGQTLAAPTLPAQALVSVFKGDQSPRAAATGMWEGSLKALGLGGYKPTTGTMFRHELGSIAEQIPELKGLNIGNYRGPTAGYESFDPKAVAAAQQIGNLLAEYSPHAKADQAGYGIQAENILLNQYGNKLTGMLPTLLPYLQGQGQKGGTTPDWTIGGKGELVYGGAGPAPYLNPALQKQLRASGGGATPEGALSGVYSPSPGAAPIPLPASGLPNTGLTSLYQQIAQRLGLK